MGKKKERIAELKLHTARLEIRVRLLEVRASAALAQLASGLATAATVTATLRGERERAPELRRAEDHVHDRAPSCRYPWRFRSCDEVSIISPEEIEVSPFPPYESPICEACGESCEGLCEEGDG